jgi:hypothetical protein
MRMSVSTETALMPGSNLSLPEGVRNAGVRDNWSGPSANPRGTAPAQAACCGDLCGAYESAASAIDVRTFGRLPCSSYASEFGRVRVRAAGFNLGPGSAALLVFAVFHCLLGSGAVT